MSLTLEDIQYLKDNGYKGSYLDVISSLRSGEKQSIEDFCRGGRTPKAKKQRGGKHTLLAEYTEGMISELEKQRGYMKSLALSDKTNERLQKAGYSPDEAENEMYIRGKRIGTASPIYKHSKEMYGNSGMYNTRDHNIIVATDYPQSTTPAHEFSHASLVKQFIPKANEDLMDRSFKGRMADHHYYSDPGEVKARIDEMRYDLYERGIYDAREEEFTLDHLNQYRKIRGKGSQLIILDNLVGYEDGNDKHDEDVIRIMNEIAQNKQQQEQPIWRAQEGGKTKQLKEVEIKGLSPREQAYKDSLDLYNDGSSYITRDLEDTYRAYGFSNPEELRKYYHGIGRKPENNPKWINRFMGSDFLRTGSESEWEVVDMAKQAQKSNIRPVSMYPPGEYSLTWSPIFKKPVHNPTPMKGIQSLPATNISTQQQRNIQPAPNGFTTPLPGYAGVKVQYNQEGKPLWMVNRQGDRIPYEPTSSRKLSKEFVYPKKLQPGGKTNLFRTDKTAYADSVHDARREDLRWVDRFFDKNGLSIPTPKDVPGYKPGYTSTHLMSDNGQGYVFPRIVQQGDSLVDLGVGAEDYARKHKIGIQFPKEQGTWYARDGYKKGTGVLKDFQRGGYTKSQENIEADYRLADFWNQKRLEAEGDQAVLNPYDKSIVQQQISEYQKLPPGLQNLIEYAGGSLIPIPGARYATKFIGRTFPKGAIPIKAQRELAKEEGSRWVKEYAKSPITRKKVNAIAKRYNQEVNEAIDFRDYYMGHGNNPKSGFSKVDYPEARRLVQKDALGKFNQRLDRYIESEQSPTRLVSLSEMRRKSPENFDLSPLGRLIDEVNPGQTSLRGVSWNKNKGTDVGRYFKPKEIKSATVHEETHQYLQPFDEPRNLLQSPVKSKYDKPSLKDSYTFKEAKSHHEKYLARMKEIHSRGLEIKKDLDIRPGIKFSKDHTDRIIDIGAEGGFPEIGKQFFRLAKRGDNPKVFRNVLNDLPKYAAPIGGAGAAIAYPHKRNKK